MAAVRAGRFFAAGQVATDDQLLALQTRMDDIMMGRADVDYDQMMMQLDRVDGPDSGPGPQSKGFKGATLSYRKIQDLEYDDIFLDYMQHPLFRELCARVYGVQADIACFRAMFMNKPAGKMLTSSGIKTGGPTWIAIPLLRSGRR